jgi:hypothetical protein
VSSFQDFRSKQCMHFSHAGYMPHPSHPPWFDHPNNIWWSVQVIKLLIMQSSPSPASSCPLCPNILLSTMCSDTLNPFDFLPKQGVNLTVFVLSSNRGHGKKKDWNDFYKNSPHLICSSGMQFWFITVVPKYLNFATFSYNSLATSKVFLHWIFWWCDK